MTDANTERLLERIGGLEEAVAQLTSERQQLQRSLTAARADADEARRELRGKESALAAAQAEAEEARARAAAVRKQADEQRRARGEAELRAVSLASERDELGGTVAAAWDRVAATQEEKKALQEDRRALELHARGLERDGEYLRQQNRSLATRLQEAIAESEGAARGPSEQLAAVAEVARRISALVDAAVGRYMDSFATAGADPAERAAAELEERAEAERAAAEQALGSLERDLLRSTSASAASSVPLPHPPPPPEEEEVAGADGAARSGSGDGSTTRGPDAGLNATLPVDVTDDGAAPQSEPHDTQEKDAEARASPPPPPQEWALSRRSTPPPPPPAPLAAQEESQRHAAALLSPVTVALQSLRVLLQRLRLERADALRRERHQAAALAATRARLAAAEAEAREAEETARAAAARLTSVEHRMSGAVEAAARAAGEHTARLRRAAGLLGCAEDWDVALTRVAQLAQRCEYLQAETDAALRRAREAAGGGAAAANPSRPFSAPPELPTDDGASSASLVPQLQDECERLRLENTRLRQEVAEAAEAAAAAEETHRNRVTEAAAPPTLLNAKRSALEGDTRDRLSRALSPSPQPSLSQQQERPYADSLAFAARALSGVAKDLGEALQQRRALSRLLFSPNATWPFSSVIAAATAPPRPPLLLRFRRAVIAVLAALRLRRLGDPSYPRECASAAQPRLPIPGTPRVTYRLRLPAETASVAAAVTSESDSERARRPLPLLRTHRDSGPAATQELATYLGLLVAAVTRAGSATAGGKSAASYGQRSPSSSFASSTPRHVPAPLATRLGSGLRAALRAHPRPRMSQHSQHSSRPPPPPQHQQHQFQRRDYYEVGGSSSRATPTYTGTTTASSSSRSSTPPPPVVLTYAASAPPTAPAAIPYPAPVTAPRAPASDTERALRDSIASDVRARAHDRSRPADGGGGGGGARLETMDDAFAAEVLEYIQALDRRVAGALHRNTLRTP